MNSERELKIKSFLSKHELSAHSYDLVSIALTHKSYNNEKGDRSKKTEQHNQRLEFLGDAVLGMVISEYLFENFKNLPEGALTKKKSAIVCEPSLAKVGNTLELGDKLLLGRGEISTGGATRTSNIADAVEAVIAAIFLSMGYFAVKQFILDNFQQVISQTDQDVIVRDYKSQLQEHLMKTQKSNPAYTVISEQGPDHDKIFTVSLSISGTVLNEGMGKTRKSAEQEAARKYMLENSIKIQKI